MFFLLTLVPAILFACGNILEKSGIVKATENVSLKNPIVFFKKILLNFKWWLGLCFSGIATLGYYLAMAKYDLSLVQPMMVLNPVLTALFGYWLLKETLTKRIVLAISFVLSGLLLAGQNMGESTSIQNISSLYQFSFIFIAGFLLMRFFIRDNEITDSLLIGVGFGLSAVFYKSISLDFVLESFNYVLFWNLISDIRIYAYIFLYLIAFFYSQIAFSRGRALFIIPFSAAIGAVIPILGGAFIFGEHFPVSKIISVSLVIIGSFLFVKK